MSFWLPFWLPIGLNESFWESFFLTFLGGAFFISFRLYEESQSKTATTTPASTMLKTKTGVPQSPPMPQGPLVRIWPGSHEDAGVLILSDSDSDDSYELDED